MKNITFTIVILLALAACNMLYDYLAYTKAYVYFVYDGDTIMVNINGKSDKIRLARIDAPEMNEHNGKSSRDALRALISNKQIRFTSKARGYYNRIIGEVYYNNINISDWLVKNKYAVYKKYY